MHNPETGQKTWRMQAVRNIALDRKGFQVVVHERIFGELTKTGFYRVTSEPVRCEHWQVLPSGIRMGGGKEACDLRLKLLGMISEAEIKGEMKLLAEKRDNFMF
eukprot:UN5139